MDVDSLVITVKALVIVGEASKPDRSLATVNANLAVEIEDQLEQSLNIKTGIPASQSPLLQEDEHQKNSRQQ